MSGGISTIIEEATGEEGASTLSNFEDLTSFASCIMVVIGLGYFLSGLGAGRYCNSKTKKVLEEFGLKLNFAI